MMTMLEAWDHKTWDKQKRPTSYKNIGLHAIPLSWLMHRLCFQGDSRLRTKPLPSIFWWIFATINDQSYKKDRHHLLQTAGFRRKTNHNKTSDVLINLLISPKKLLPRPPNDMNQQILGIPSNKLTNNLCRRSGSKIRNKTWNLPKTVRCS